MDAKSLLKLLLLLHRPRFIVWLLLLLLVFAIANEIAIYNIGLITGDYYQILNNKDKDAFIKQTIKSLLLITGKFAFFGKTPNCCHKYHFSFLPFSGMAVLKSLKEYIASYLYIQWRSHLSGDLQDNYFLNLAYYRLNVLNVSRKKPKASQLPNEEKSIPNDNVDQRITQDVDKMASNLSYIVPEIIVSPFIIGKLCFLGLILPILTLCIQSFTPTSATI